MKDVYETETSDKGRDVIIIRRKPSQIPIHIDRQLMHIGTMGLMDGPNNYCAYEFIVKDGLEKAQKILQACGWTKIPPPAEVKAHCKIGPASCHHCAMQYDEHGNRVFAE